MIYDHAAFTHRYNKYILPFEGKKGKDASLSPPGGEGEKIRMVDFQRRRTKEKEKPGRKMGGGEERRGKEEGEERGKEARHEVGFLKPGRKVRRRQNGKGGKGGGRRRRNGGRGLVVSR